VSEPEGASSSFRERLVKDWTIEDVVQWCRSEETISKFAHRLEKWRITGEVLLTITAGNVHKITKIGGKDGDSIHRAVEELKKADDELQHSTSPSKKIKNNGGLKEKTVVAKDVVSEAASDDTVQSNNSQIFTFDCVDVKKEAVKILAPAAEVVAPGLSTMNNSPDEVRSKAKQLFRTTVGETMCLEDPDVDYDEELYTWMLDRETKTRPNTQYMKWHPSLNEKMRSILLDWLMEVCREFEMQRETFHLTVNIVDRFLSAVSEVSAR